MSFSKKLVAALGIITLFVIPIYAHQQPKSEVKYTLTGTLQEFQNMAFAISNPDDVTANQRKQITDFIQKNLALADTTKPKK